MNQQGTFDYFYKNIKFSVKIRKFFRFLFFFFKDMSAQNHHGDILTQHLMICICRSLCENLWFGSDVFVRPISKSTNIVSNEIIS